MSKSSSLTGSGARVSACKDQSTAAVAENAAPAMTPRQAVDLLRKRFPSRDGWNVVVQGTFFSYARGEQWGFPVSEGYLYTVSAFKSGGPAEDVPHLCSTEFRQTPDSKDAETIADAVAQFLHCFGEQYPEIETPTAERGRAPLFATSGSEVAA